MVDDLMDQYFLEDSNADEIPNLDLNKVNSRMDEPRELRETALNKLEYPE